MASYPEAVPPDVPRAEAANSREALRAQVHLIATSALQAILAVLLEQALHAVFRWRTASDTVELIHDLATDHLAGCGYAAFLQLGGEHRTGHCGQEYQQHGPEEGAANGVHGVEG